MNGEQRNCVKDDTSEWVIAETPARIDLSGGWSDTPPITHEHGGTVTNIAVKVDGIKPIGSKIRKIPEFELVLVLCGSNQVSQTLTCNTLNDMRDYSNPSAPGALLKTAFLCTKTLSFSSPYTLPEQLQMKYGCGFELHAWSNLPHGSGLGTSSILAGAVCAAIWTITKRRHDNNDLIHLVIELEQMLTTGGGWQDQVGGLIPGVKMTTSPAKTPIQVVPTVLNVNEDMLKKVESNMALIYTGKTRLAKGLLQNVLKRWAARTPEIVKNVDNLTSNAEACADAWEQGDLEKICRCVNLYRKQKKIMAPDSEPEEIHEIINNIKPHIDACCFAGAGGGGFLFVITKQANIHKQLEDILQNIHKDNNLYTVHRIAVDNEGLTTHRLPSNK